MIRLERKAPTKLHLKSSLLNYLEVTKPRIWLLLVFTAFGASIVASAGRVSYTTMITMLVAVTLGSAGANTLTCYIDRDIDGVMNRTKLRPLPTRRIHPSEKALYFGVILAGLSLIISYWFINLLSAILMLAGLMDNVLVYSRILKRRNPVSIILGGFSGGIPALIGYSSVTNSIDLLSIILAGLVVLWIPSHIWSLALRSKEDYQKAGIPMLPVVVDEDTAVRCIASTSILMVLFSIVPFALGYFSLTYLYSAVTLGMMMLAVSFWLLVRPSKKRAWTLFKISSPYLALIFIAMIVDILIQ
jgi:protoheme IX farnesyltransferase